MEQQQRAYERKMRKWDREEKVLKAGGQDTTEAQRWKSYYKGKLNALIKSSDGFLKRDYSAEKAWSNTKATKPKDKQTQKLPPIRNQPKVSTKKGTQPLIGTAPRPKMLKPPAERKTIGNLDPTMFAVSNLQTAEVILMKEREAHIKANHPEAYDDVMKNLTQLVVNPDIVIEDTKRPGTRCSVLNLDNSAIRLVIKLSTTTDAIGYKNSIITGQLIKKTRIDRYIRGNRYIVVYKKLE